MRTNLQLAALCLLTHALISAQTPQPLKLNSRLIIEDVTVTDRAGHPVHGLPATAFHLLDNDQPQTLRSVEEAATPPPDAASALPATPLPRGTFTNTSLLQSHGPVVVLLIDPSTMSLEEQMFLRLQATKFVDHAPPATTLSIFRVNDRGVPVLLQPLTANKVQLNAAIAAAIPTFTRGSGRPFGNAITELKNISDYLRPVPGRKAVLWLAGAFPLYQEPDYTVLCASGSECLSRPVDVHLSAEQDAYRALAEARVAVYPIDVRGVQMGGLTSVGIADRSPGAVAGNIGAKPTSANERASGQYDEMDLLAEATGGQAFYSNNDIRAGLANALHAATAGYTLTYRPTNAADDGTWHHIALRVDGPYQLHYRTGYFAAPASPPRPESPRRLLAAGNEPKDQPAQEAVPSRPLLFSAHLVADASTGKTSSATTRQVHVRFVIPASQLSFTGPDAGHARIRLAALAYNVRGDVTNQSLEIVETHYTPQQLALAQRIGIPADQAIDVVRDAGYLLLAVEDLQTGSVGALQLPLSQVPRDGSPSTSH